MTSILQSLRGEAAHRAATATPDRKLVERVATSPNLLSMIQTVLVELLRDNDSADEWLQCLSSVPLDEAHLEEDLARYCERDFTANGPFDVLWFSNGFHARTAHRFAHRLWGTQQRHVARVVQARATQRFGTDIHPAATLGRRLFLDHGLAVVIGETAVLGDDCSVFQGVTLGSTAKQPGRRHPTVGNRVTLGAHATLIGTIVVGDDARIGPGAIVTKDVPDRARVV